MHMDDSHLLIQMDVGGPGEDRFPNILEQQKATMSVFSETIAESLMYVLALPPHWHKRSKTKSQEKTKITLVKTSRSRWEQTQSSGATTSWHVTRLGIPK